MRRVPARILAPLILFAALLLPRISYLVELRVSAPTYDRPEGGDAIYYDRVASGAPVPRRAYVHSPLYQWYLTGLYAIFGRSLTLVRVLQHLLGALGAVVVYLATLRLWQRRGTAVVAGAIAGLFGPGIFYEAQLLPDALMPVLLAAVLLAAVTYRERPDRWHGLALGAAVGLAALGRATSLAFLPILLVWSYAGRGADDRSLRRPAWILLGAVLLMIPATVRNWVVEHDFVLLTSNGGLNLFIGNNPSADGTYNLPDGLWFRPGDPSDDFYGRQMAQEALGHVPTSTEISAYWRDRALLWLAEEPMRFLELGVIKSALLIGDFEIRQLSDYYAYREICHTLEVLPTAGFLMAPALVGLVLALRRPARRPGAGIAAALALAFAASFLPFFVVGRYRAPWIALLAPFAAWTVAAVWDAFAANVVRRGVILVVVTLALAAVTFIPLARNGPPSEQYLAFGDAEMSRRHAERAIHWYSRSVDANPLDPRPHVNLGVAYASVGKMVEARAALERAHHILPGSARIANNLGLVQKRQGDLPAAEASFKKAINLDPSLAEAYANLGDILATRGHTRMALDALRSSLMLADPGAAWVGGVRERIQRLERAPAPLPPGDLTPPRVGE